MLPSYDDIRSRISEEPKWWDEHGVPRYEPFHPDMLGIYDSEAALIEIQCQRCGKTFLVGIGWEKTRIFLTEGRYARPTAGNIGSYHYGDPPRHGWTEGCVAGDTMNCVSIRVVEFWSHHDDRYVDKETGYVGDVTRYFEWTRLPEHEVEIEGENWREVSGE